MRIERTHPAAVAAEYFGDRFPVLTPLAFDPGRPFPHISNLSLNLAVLIRDRAGDEHFARVKVPDSLPQLVPLSGAGRPIQAHAQEDRPGVAGTGDRRQSAKLFPGMEILEAHPFHVTRDADIAIKELEAEDLLETIEEGVRQRRFGSVVRLLVNQDMPAHILKILMNNLEVEAGEVYRTGPLSLKRLIALARSTARPEGRAVPARPFPQALARASDEEDMFTLIRRRDILLHHPFDSFQPVVDFLRKAARDPAVLAIKMVPLPRGPQFAGGGGAAGSRRGRQAGGRAGGAEGALRRREQHRMGARWSASAGATWSTGWWG
jgi:polyphosphate kinase